HRRGGPAAHLRAVLLHQVGGQRARPRHGLPGGPGAWGRDRCALHPGGGHALLLHPPRRAAGPVAEAADPEGLRASVEAARIPWPTREYWWWTTRKACAISSPSPLRSSTSR